MTNYNERLDEILSYEHDVEGCQALHSGSKCLHCNEDPCPHCKRWGGRQRTEVRSMVDKKTRQAILDWHNKQVEEVLDRLESTAAYGTDIEEYAEDVLSAIEVERNKLKERDDDQL